MSSATVRPDGAGPSALRLVGASVHLHALLRSTTRRAVVATDEVRPPERSTVPTLATRAKTWADSAAGQVALRAKEYGIWREYTWGDTWDLVLDAAHALLGLGVEPGDRVSIHAENRPEWTVLDLAAVAVRGATVGIYPSNPMSETEHLLTDCGATIHMVEDQEQADKALDIARSKLPDLRRIVYVEPRGMESYDDDRLVSWDAFLALGREHRAAHPDAVAERMAEARDDDLVALVYTSGTTAPPKGVMLTNTNVDFAIGQLILWPERFPDRQPPRPTDLIVSYLPLPHIAERVHSTWTLVAGGSVLHFAESLDTVEANLREVQPTIFFGVPRIWERLHGATLARAADASWSKRRVLGVGLRLGRSVGRTLAANGGRHTLRSRLAYIVGWVLAFRALRQRIGLRRVRYAAAGGAPLAPEVLEFFMGIGVKVFEFYGMTENTAIATVNLPGRVALGTAGEPYPDIGFRIDHETGEIQTKHDGNFVGYWNRPDATSDAFTDDGWLRTGDVGERVDGTHVRVLDRIDHLIVTSDGARRSPSEIESALKTSIYIREAMVVVDRHDRMTALLGIELNAVAGWAAKRNIAYTTYRDLAEKSEVVELVDTEVRRIKEQHSQLADVEQTVLIPKDLAHEDGELTATQVLKRHVVQERFADLVEATYA